MGRKEIVVRLERIKQLVGEVPRGWFRVMQKTEDVRTAEGRTPISWWLSTQRPLFDDQAVER